MKDHAFRMTNTVMDSHDEKIDTLRMLYPLYKEEVYRRRGEMMKVTALGSGFLLILLFSLSLMIPKPMAPMYTLVLLSGVAIFSSLLIFLIIQQRDRHRMAKQALIELERILGLYREGFYLDHQALYPQEWETAWLKDRSHSLYIGIIGLLMLLLMSGIIFHSPI